MRVTLILATGAAIAAMALAEPPEASAVTPCEHRSASHISSHGGLAADSAWHVANGQLPTCDTGSAAQRKDAPQQNERESRFCRKRWWC